jgi:pimeloyl-ACP methyl ester carboxylesterase
MLPSPDFLSVGNGHEARPIAYRFEERAGPCLTWLGGYRSDMLSTKATYLSDGAASLDLSMLRLDYSGHGESGGDFKEGTISRWLEESLAVIEQKAADKPLILVGSSMGGWIATLLAQTLQNLKGVILIAPAIDMTQALMLPKMSAPARQTLQTKGFIEVPSLYSPDPYIITRKLIEDGERHLLLSKEIRFGCPVHILQGMEDPDVPPVHVFRSMESMAHDDITLTLIRDGDHRLSRPQDLEKLKAALEGILKTSAG